MGGLHGGKADLQISVKPTVENSPLLMAGRPALQDSTTIVKSSINTNTKPAMDRYSSCNVTHFLALATWNAY